MDSLSTVARRGGSETSTSPSSGQTAHHDRTNSGAPALADLYAPIAHPLRDVETRLRQELTSPYESLVPVLRHGTQLGGKRLRPALLLLAGQATGQLSEAHTVLATVIEMVHTATLIHDDVLDEADTRRHVPTVNARWNQHTSILLGDYLFAQSFRLAATLPSTRACQMIGEASRMVCEGELRQVLDRNLIALDEATYLDILRGKTAELCRVACELGAIQSGADESMVQAMADYGHAIGIAFQIADDFLDLWGDDQTVGKTLGTDIQQGKMTLPLIRLLQTSSTEKRRQVISILEGPCDKRLSQIRPLLEASDARQYTAETALRYGRAAEAALEAVPASESRDCLSRIARFSVDRKF